MINVFHVSGQWFQYCGLLNIHHTKNVSTLYKCPNTQTDLGVFSSTCDADGLLSRPLFVRLSRPLSDEKRPLLRCLYVRDSERLLSVASSLEQILTDTHITIIELQNISFFFFLINSDRLTEVYFPHERQSLQSAFHFQMIKTFSRLL